MDNWQGANIQNPHNLGVVLIASRAFPGNNFVPLPTSVTCVWPINWRIRDRPRQALLECPTPGCYRHAKTRRPGSAIFSDLVLIISLLCYFRPFMLISVVYANFLFFGTDFLKANSVLALIFSLQVFLGCYTHGQCVFAPLQLL